MPPEGEFPFTVDSALLRELGERLVGKPHIALAELIKNSYDADATSVDIRFSSDRIEVRDNGHGMDLESFRRLWMRIGSPHKERQAGSPKYRRRLTGSKGVGRLSVQFLANRIELRTVSEGASDTELVAEVNWSEAISKGTLTEATARYRLIPPETEFPTGERHGMVIILTGLNQRWSADEFGELAREIWALQPPFRPHPKIEKADSFTVELHSPDQRVVESFQAQMEAFLHLWHARLVGRLSEVADGPSPKARLDLSLEFAGSTPISVTYEVDNFYLTSLDFEIRIFHLRNRQKHGVRVQELRDYLNRHGGVHIYDSGFHLPYYGPESDWLRIEIDHSHRLASSKLLPRELQVSEGLNFLPTNSRIFGVVHVDTPREAQAQRASAEGAQKTLRIQVSRDRLVDNAAFETLRHAVRWALDYYAMQEALRAIEEREHTRTTEPLASKVDRLEVVVDRYENEIPAPVRRELKREVKDVLESVRSESEVITGYAGLLASLATAGMTALAHEHEAGKQLNLLRDVAVRMAEIAQKLSNAELRDTVGRLNSWIDSATDTRRLFIHLLDEENRELRDRFPSQSFIRNFVDTFLPILRGVEVETSGIDPNLRFPLASYAELTALLQNVFINAVNATLDSANPLIRVRSDATAKRRSILVEDNGIGVDLETADELFAPFYRKLELSDERRALGLGGSGLGLTIVKIIADRIGADVHFTDPLAPFCTAFAITWREK